MYHLLKTEFTGLKEASGTLLSLCSDPAHKQSLSNGVAADCQPAHCPRLITDSWSELVILLLGHTAKAVLYTAAAAARQKPTIF